MIVKSRKPFLAACMSIYLLCLFSSPALAGMIGSALSPEASDSGIRKTEIGKIQRAIETEIVRGKLEAYGLSAEEISQRLDGMSDEQLHMLAQASEQLLAGGDGGEVVIAVLLIILIVLLILYLTNKHVVIR